ncbi:MAG: hypothetical protein BWY91_00909 [bacterium ADurb.BinA028]|nr:MAG: hypothetical protein BWY91_00909 [bacterium ADurb.BinA028]
MPSAVIAVQVPVLVTVAIGVADSIHCIVAPGASTAAWSLSRTPSALSARSWKLKVTSPVFSTS